MRNVVKRRNESEWGIRIGKEKELEDGGGREGGKG